MVAPDDVFQEFANNEEAQEYYREHNSKRDDVAEEKLRPLIDGLNKRNQLWGFDGFIGQMHFNKLFNAAPDEVDFGDRLREDIQPPESIDEAKAKIDSFAEYTQWLKDNDIDSDPFPKSTIFFLSYFWHI